MYFGLVRQMRNHKRRAKRRTAFKVQVPDSSQLQIGKGLADTLAKDSMERTLSVHRKEEIGRLKVRLFSGPEALRDTKNICFRSSYGAGLSGIDAAWGYSFNFSPLLPARNRLPPSFRPEMCWLHNGPLPSSAS